MAAAKGTKGKVKWFSKTKGYGFIEAEDGRELFAHYSDIQAEGFKVLEEGQDVIFDVGQNEKGEKAINIRVAS